MANFIGQIGKQVLPRAAAKQAHRRGWLDLKLGYALLRDQRVSVLSKLAAIATGITLTAILVALELPVEGIVGALLPFLGFVLDFAIDGMELLILPMVIGSLAIRWFAPKAVVESLRR